MKRIMILSSYVVDNAKANIAVNKKFVKLSSSVFDETLFITSNYPEKELKNIPNAHLINIPIKWNGTSQKKDLIKFFHMQLKSIKMIKKNYQKGDLIVFWLSGPMIIPFLYCKLTRKKIVSYLYGNSKYKLDKPSIYNTFISFLTGYMGKHADYLGVESKSVLKQWNIVLDEHRIIESPLYVNLEKFHEEIPHNKRNKIIGMSCRLQSNKKPLETIQAFHNLRSFFPDWQLEIAGNGPQFEECCALIQELGEGDRIRMLGWIDNRDISYYYNRWQLLFFPSNYEGLPNSVIECMCCGTPVVASPVGGIPDIIRDGENGWFLEDTSASSLEKTLQQVLSSPKLELIARNAKKFATEKFEFHAILDNFKMKYESI